MKRLHEYIQKGFTLDDERLEGNATAIFASCSDE